MPPKYGAQGTNLGKRGGKKAGKKRAIGLAVVGTRESVTNGETQYKGDEGGALASAMLSERGEKRRRA